MTTTTNLGITHVQAAQAQKEVTVNEAFNRIDALMNSGAIDKDLATPPASPSAGDLYIVASSSATDAWEGHENAIAYFDQIWRFITPNDGVALWVVDEEKLYRFNGTAWIEQSGTGGGGGGVSDGEVTTAKLANNAVTNAKMADAAVDTAELADGAVTTAKMANMATAKVLGNVSGSSAAPSEVSILDEYDMASNSATALATQQSIKAYVDANAGGGGGSVADGSITTAKLADDAVTNAKLADNAADSAQIADSAIITSKLANNAVTLAKMATIADAKLLGNLSGSSAVPAEISIVDEDDMASNSAIAIPTQQSVKAYVDANSGGGGGGSSAVYTEISKTTLSSATATVDITIPSGYVDYTLIWDSVDGNGEDFWLRVDTGSGFASSQYYYNVMKSYNTGGSTAPAHSGSTNQAQILLHEATSTGFGTANGRMRILFGTTRPTFSWRSEDDGNNHTGPTVFEGSGWYNSYLSTISEVRFMRASGNMTTGTFILLGVATS